MIISRTRTLTSSNVEFLRKVGFTEAQIVALLGIIHNSTCEAGEFFPLEAIEESIDRRLEEQAENERRERQLRRNEKI